MHAADYLAAGISLLAILTAVLGSLQKLPWMKTHPQVLGWITEANAIAGQIRLMLPQGSTIAQAKAAATTEAAALVTKYAGGPSQAEAVAQIMGTLGSIVEDGHILPASAVPAENAIMAELSKIQALLAEPAVVAHVVEPVAAPA
jgi:hypothetical protein